MQPSMHTSYDTLEKYIFMYILKGEKFLNEHKISAEIKKNSITFDVRINNNGKQMSR